MLFCFVSLGILAVACGGGGSASMVPSMVTSPSSYAAQFDIVKDFGADNSGVADSTSAIDHAVKAINAAGGNATLVFPPGTYNVFSSKQDSPSSFSDVDGLWISGYGATIRENTSWNVNESRSLFSFQNTVNNVRISGFTYRGAVTREQVALGTYTGCAFAYFAGNAGGGNNIEIEDVTVSGAGSATQMTRKCTEPMENLITNVHFRNIKASDSVYGITLNNTAWNTVVDSLSTDWVYRSFFVWGMKGVKATIVSKDNQGNDCFLNADNGRGIENAEIDYTNTESTATISSAANRILILFNTTPTGTTPSVFDNISIRTTQVFAPGANTGWMALQFMRSPKDNAIVHVLHNFTLSGYIKGVPKETAFGVAGMNGDYDWTNGDFRNIALRNLVLEDTNGINIVSNPIKDEVIVDNVVFRSSSDLIRVHSN
jgi:polygalacturonase